ncbi:MAG: bacillithiol biosynthesis cysteine-adding enzyme BshC, partial [Acidobacteria bacterium]
MASNSPDSRLLANPQSEPATRLAVDVRRFPGVRRLAVDYAYDFARVAPFFSGNPVDRQAWAEAIARSQAHNRRRAEVAGIVAAQQRQRGAPLPAVEAARRLTDPRTVAIVTGQQAGLFGGPLYTLLKAVTALQLADHVAREHGVPTVAVFWIDAEDHDWNEVRSCTVFDDAFGTRTLSLPMRSGVDHAPVGPTPLDGSIGPVLDELAQALPKTEFSASLLAQLRREYTPGVGVAEAFGCWLEHVLGDRGLVVYDSSDRAAKQGVADVFARELSTPGETGRLAAAAGSDLITRGYHSQVHAQEDGLALFRLDGARRPIRIQNGQFLVGDTRYSPDALRREAATRPDGFSPNVLLRPIVQDTLFPTVCYVAGPNELAYLGQLRGVYQHFGVPMPLMHP